VDDAFGRALTPTTDNRQQTTDSREQTLYFGAEPAVAAVVRVDASSRMRDFSAWPVVR
jgi:hypothetical protein